MIHTSEHTKRWISSGLMVVFVLGVVSLGIFSTQKELRAEGAADAGAEIAAKAARAACLRSGAVPSTCPPDAIGEVLDTVSKKFFHPRFASPLSKP